MSIFFNPSITQISAAQLHLCIMSFQCVVCACLKLQFYNYSQQCSYFLSQDQTPHGMSMFFEGQRCGKNFSLAGFSTQPDDEYWS